MEPHPTAASHGGSCARTVGGAPPGAQRSGAVLRTAARTYLSGEFGYCRNWLPLLVAHGGRALAVPGPQLLDALQVEQGAEAGAVILDHREVLVLDSAAHLEDGRRQGQTRAFPR